MHGKNAEVTTAIVEWRCPPWKEHFADEGI
jgi:hypothetical protein